MTGPGQETSVARILLRPVGSPLTIGMSGLAVASLVQSGLDLHWIAPDQAHQVGLILSSVPFLLQMIACIFCYLARDGATGATVGVLSVSWLADGLVHLTSVPGSRSGALGLMLLASGATPATAYSRSSSRARSIARCYRPSGAVTPRQHRTVWQNSSAGSSTSRASARPHDRRPYRFSADQAALHTVTARGLTRQTT